MALRPAVSIIVLNYNGETHVRPLWTALVQQTERSFELIFVDNGSTDGSLDIISNASSQDRLNLNLIRNANNLGFAPACNQGIRAAQADWVILLNNDTRPEPTWLAALLAAAHADPDVGMVATKLLRMRDPEQIDSAGIAVDRAGIAWDRRGGDVDLPAERDVVEVFGPCGGAGMYARSMLEQIGGLDDDFFAYLEDVDLAWRARLAGWRCVFQPQARALHAHSATLGDASPLKRFLLARNKIWLVVKNYPQPWFVRYLPAIMGYDLLATVYGVSTRGDFASLRGRLSGLLQLKRFWTKRQKIQRRWHDVDNLWRMVEPLEPAWRVPQRYAHLNRERHEPTSVR